MPHVGSYKEARFMFSLYRALRFMYSNGGLYRAYGVLKFKYRAI